MALRKPWPQESRAARLDRGPLKVNLWCQMETDLTVVSTEKCTINHPRAHSNSLAGRQHRLVNVIFVDVLNFFQIRSESRNAPRLARDCDPLPDPRASTRLIVARISRAPIITNDRSIKGFLSPCVMRDNLQLLYYPCAATQSPGTGMSPWPPWT